MDAKLRVGGPATAQAAWVGDFIAHCTAEQDAVRFCVHACLRQRHGAGRFRRQRENSAPRHGGARRQKSYDQVKSSAAPNTPIIWSEYNATYMNQPEVTDSAFMGPWLANTIRECDGLVALAYWCFSDVFDEQGVVKTPFYGGFGIIAERGIPKAAFRAFELLHRLGDQRIANQSEDSLVTKRTDGTVVIALWNYAGPGQNGQPKFFRLQPAGSSWTTYRIVAVDENHGSALKAWMGLGQPKTPTNAQIKELRDASELGPPEVRPLSEPIVLSPHALAIVELANGQ